jgi:hypothetical protein
MIKCSPRIDKIEEIPKKCEFCQKNIPKFFVMFKSLMFPIEYRETYVLCKKCLEKKMKREGGI